MAFSRAFLPLSLVTCLACAPTISLPRGTDHLDALAEAEAHQHHGRFPQAADAYGRAAASAERRVDRDEALYRQSRVMARMGDLKNAIAVCDELASADPPARRTMRAKLDASRYRLHIGQDTERADYDLRTLLIEHPDDAAAKGALRELTQIHVKGVDQVDVALDWVRELQSQVQEGAPINEALMNLEAELLIVQGNRQDAIDVLQRQIKLYPYPKGSRWDDALWQLADLALEDEDPKGAIGHLEAMISVHESSLIIGSYTRPRFSKAALRIARIYRDELHDSKAAIKAYAHVRSEFPRSLVVDDALEEEAMLRIETGDRGNGCDLLREVLEKHEVGSARRRAEARLSESCQ